MAARAQSRTNFHRGVGRVAAILEYVCAAKSGARLTQVATHIGAPKSSVHGLLRGLVGVGYLSESGGIYSAGPGLAVLIEKSGPELLIGAARPELEALVAEFGETATLGMRVGRSVVYIDHVESEEPIRYVAPMHKRRPLSRSSMGKLFLAHMDPIMAEELLRQADEMDGLGTNERMSEEEIASIRDRGVAFNAVAVKRSEATAEVQAVAAGISGQQGLMGGISVIGPAERVVPKLDDITAALLESAGQISKLVQRAAVDGEPAGDGLPV